MLAVLPYNVLHGGAPSYLSPFLRVADLPGRRALRSASSDFNHLVLPPVKLSTVGSRAFPITAAQSGTACLTTSFWMIRCRPFGVDSNIIICSSSPIPIVTVVQLCYYDTLSGHSSGSDNFIQATLKITD